MVRQKRSVDLALKAVTDDELTLPPPDSDEHMTTEGTRRIAALIIGSTDPADRVDMSGNNTEQESLGRS